MSDQFRRQVLEELRGLRADVRAQTAEIRKLVRATEGDPGCPECGGELEETSTMAGARKTCTVCSKSYVAEVVSG